MFFSLERLASCCACAAATAVLVGCGDATYYPDTSISASVTNQVPVGTIQGTNYGGHAPIVGSHIYLLQPGTTGYGSVTKGLLNASYAGSFATTQNPAVSGDQFVPAADSAGNPYYYETTDTTGAFNLTGDYTCTVGQPVFIVGYGGNPSYQGAGPNVFSLSGADVIYSDGSHAIFTYTVSSPLPELFYIGESVAVTNFGGGSEGFNISGTVADPGDSTQTVTVGGTTYTPTLSTTQFSIYASTGLGAGTYFPFNGAAAAPTVTLIAAAKVTGKVGVRP